MDVETSRKRTGQFVLGVILLVLGVVWTSQGAGLLTGSIMTGKTLWLVIGIATFVCGLGLTVGALRIRWQR